MRVRLCVVSILAVSASLVAGFVGPAGAVPADDRADRPDRTGRSITVDDPAGDVIDVQDADTVRKGRSVDITRASYRVERQPYSGSGPRQREQVTFEVENRRILRGGGDFGLCSRQLMTVVFSSGARQYRATTGARTDLVSRVGSGP